MNNSQTRKTLIGKVTALFVIGFVVSGLFGFTLSGMQNASAASAPNTTSYQGRILNSNGVPVSDASLSMKFEFYTAASGGTCLWSNSSVDCDSDTPASTTARTVTLTGGLFSELLGDTTDGSPYAAIGDAIFGNNSEVYLQVYIGGETLTPRKELAAVPYALNSDTLDGNDTSYFLAASGDTATGNHDYTSAIFMGASPLIFEGTTDDAFQTTFAITDTAGSSKTITFKNETGTVALLSDISGGLFTDSGTVTYLTSTADDFAVGGTTFSVAPFGVDQATNSIYIGDGAVTSGNIIFKASNSATGTLTYGTGDSFDFNGGNITTDSDLTVSGGDIVLGTTSIFSGGDTASLNNIDVIDATTETTIEGAIDTLAALTVTGASDFSGSALLGASPLTFEGVSADAFETIFAITDPTVSDKIITFKNETGTVALLSDVTTPSLFTDGGAVTYLTSATDDFAIGGTSVASSPFGVDELANSIYVGQGSGSSGNIIFKASNAATGTLTYNTSDTFAFTGGAVSIDNSGALSGLHVAQNGNTGSSIPAAAATAALSIDNSSNAKIGLSVFSTNSVTTAPLAYFYQDDTSFDNEVLYVRGNSLTDSTMHILQDNALAAGAALYIDNDGTASGLHIEQDGDTISTSPGATANAALSINNTSNNNMGLSMYSNNAVATSPLAYLTGSSAFSDNVLEIQNLSTNSGIHIDNGGDASSTVPSASATAALSIDSDGNNGMSLSVYSAVGSAATAPMAYFKYIGVPVEPVMKLEGNGSVSILHIEADGNIAAIVPSATVGGAIHVNNTANDSMALSLYTNVGSTADGPLAYLFSDNTAYDEEVLYVQNQGKNSAIKILQETSLLSGIVSDTVGGALHVGNTGNVRSGLSVFSDNAAPDSPLVHFEADNIGFNNNVLYVQNDGSGVGVSVAQTGANSALYLAGSSIGVAATAPLLVLDMTEGGTTAEGYDQAMLFIDTDSFASSSGLIDIDVGGSTDSNVLTDAFNITYNPKVLTTAGRTITGNLIDVSRAPENAGIASLTVTGDIVSIVDNDPIGIGTVLNSSNLLYLNQDYASAQGDAVEIRNDGIGSALFIDQNGNTAAAVSETNGGALHIGNTNNNARGFSVYSNASTETTELVFLEVDNVSFGQEAMLIQYDGFGDALFIDDNHTASSALVIDGTITTTGYGVEVRVDGSLSTGAGIMIDYSGTASTTDAAFVVRTDVGTDNREAFIIESDGDVQIGDGALCLDNDDTCAGSTDGTLYRVAEVAGASDLAEIYPSTETLQAGDFVVIDSGNAGGVKRSTGAYEQASISVIATDPATIFGAPSDEDLIAAGFDIENDPPNWGNYMILPNTYPVTLAGRIPAKVNVENGNIAIGDLITTSSTAGVGMKSTLPGAVVGRALEAWSGPGQGTISLYILPGWHSGGTIATDGTLSTLNANFALTAIGTATSGAQGKSSNSLLFRGSGWDGTAAQAVDMVLSTDVTDSSNYKLSVKNDTGTEVAYVNQDGDLALSGKLYPSDRGILQTDKYIYYDGSAGPGGDFMRTNAAGWATGSYDFAEMFPSLDALTPGEVVVFATDKEHVARSTGETYDRKLVGIVSTRPGFLAGNNVDGHVPIALAGRVPTFVSGENGAIQPGDPLTTSTKPGYAMKATEAGPILGYAMEPFSGNTGSIITFVRSSYYDGGPVTEAPAADNIASGVTSTSNLDVSGTLNLNAGNIINVSSIAGIGNRWVIEENGDFTTEGRIIQLVNSYQGVDVETYVALGREATIQLSGTSNLQNGAAVVAFEDIDAEFNDIISSEHTYRVFLTASQPTGALYAINRTSAGFSIRESNGTSNAVVDWMVIAYHKDYAPVIIVEDNIANPIPVSEPVISPVDPVVAPTVDPLVDPAPDPLVEPVINLPIEAIPNPIIDLVPDPVSNSGTDPAPAVDPPIIPLPDPVTDLVVDPVI